ncbi:MAG: HAMP domain-containing protein [Candidatus Pacebacteria bacterium]|nr:HAMP domain-containing protein [Candidatus Paceibacterota bacterium]
MKKKGRKISIFFKAFWGILAIICFSNLLFAYILYIGYENVISQVRPFLSPETFRNIEVNIYTTWLISASSFIFIVLLVTLFTIFFVSRIIKPLFELLQAAKKVGEGNLNVKIRPYTRDEIGQLAEEFNEMIKKLKESHEVLEDEKKVLEIRVKARTKELEELAQFLDEKVKERTKELQERVKELEKFHKFTVGREIKMVELKNKIKKLEEELKKYKKNARK